MITALAFHVDSMLCVRWCGDAWESFPIKLALGVLRRDNVEDHFTPNHLFSQWEDVPQASN